MFKPNFLKVAAILAMLFSLIGIMLSFLSFEKGFSAAIAFITWTVMLISSFLCYQLCSYKLDEDDFKSLGYRIYTIFGAFVLLFFTGINLGLAIPFIILGFVYSLKKNYDNWQQT